MDPNVWGPALWDMLFFITFNVDLTTHIFEVQTLFHLLEVILPCSHCRRHYAIFKKQVPPTTVIKKSSPQSAAAWLWVIHDMVNQNLGKICISFEKLVQKHKSFSCIVSDLNIIDSFMFMWFSSKNKAKIAEGINIIIKLLKSIQTFSVCDLFSVTEYTAIEKFLECKNALLIKQHMKPQSLEQMILQYKNAIAV